MQPKLARYLMVSSVIFGSGLTPALATFHLMAVQEIFPGTAANPGAQYVMLRMTSNLQNAVSGTYVEVQDSAGTVLGRFGTMDHNVANAGTAGCAYPNCPAIVIGTSSAQALFGFAFDQIVDAQAGHILLPATAGRLCFRGSAGAGVDCVAWGGYTGSNVIPTPTVNGCDADFGTPAAALSPGFALTRTGFNCASKNNATDFANRFPHPVANNNVNANTDGDADGLIDVLDCGDADASSLYFPLEVTSDLVTGGPTMISWSSQGALSGGSTRYDVVSGDAGDLLASRSYAAASCLAQAIIGIGFTDPRPDPPVGAVFYYAVRARNGCGAATFGDSDLIPDPRDLLDGASGPCP